MPLDIAFEEKNLREVCTDAAVAQREFGFEAAQALRGRLADARAAESVADLLCLAGNPREVSQGQIQVNLAEGVVMVYTENHNSTPLADDGFTVDWSKVYRIRLLRIFLK